MKKFIQILILCFLIFSKISFSQFVKHTPYPIIFIHGINSSYKTWEGHPGTYDNVLDYLTGAGLTFGDIMNISLNYQRDASHLNTTKTQDVHLFTQNPDSGDFYLINFDVHAASGLFPRKAIDDYETKLAELYENILFDWETQIDVNRPDLFSVNDIIRIEDEFMKVIGINGNELIVNRGILGSSSSIHLAQSSIYNLSTESNQASIAKQGCGLKLAIDKIKLKTGADKVILVGHSMGGLCAREYIQSSYYNNDVAKIITIGTPHLGSNITNAPNYFMGWFTGVDGKSEAVRDLRNTMGIFNIDPGIYLFGGSESSISGYYSKDVDCNGFENDNIYGLNQFQFRSFPLNIDRTWIVSHSTTLGIYTDGIVNTNSQFISGDTLMTTGSHLDETTNYYALLRGLDEPYNHNYCYEINENSITKGFITYGIDMETVDYDLFKINITNKSKLEINLTANNSSGVNRFDILDSNLVSIKFNTNIYTPLIDTLQAGVYYIKIRGFATNTSFNFPYTLTTSSIALPSGNIITSPSDMIEYYEVVRNEFRDKTIKVSNNGSDTINVSNLNITGANADQFSIINSTTFNIPPMGERNVIVRFNPTDSLTKNATLVITNNSTDNPIINILLHGTCVNSATTKISITPSNSYSFGDVSINDSRTKSFLLKNIGSTSVTITDLILSGANNNDFSFVNLPNIPFNLVVSEEKQIKLKYSPTSIGTKNANFNISCLSLYDTIVKTISLYGNGVYNIFSPNNNYINSYEYWFDNNYSSKVTGAAYSLSSFDMIANIPTTGLNNGLHSFHIRFKDKNDNWSSIISQFFNKMQPTYGIPNNIIGYEYWFDNNYDSVVSQSVSPQQIYTMNTDIPANSLSNGLHSYHVRYKDNYSQWSSVVSQFFNKMQPTYGDTNNIVNYEYWFDNNYNSKVIQAITPQQIYSMINNIPADSLNNGLHSFHIRYKDTRGQWSSIISQFFNKMGVSITPYNTITAYRYWFDMDAVNMTTHYLTNPVNPYQLIKNICTLNQAIGNHTIHFQFKDSLQQWSSVLSHDFYKEIPVAPVISTSKQLPFCQGDTITLTPNYEGTYSWNTGESTQSINISNSGNYKVVISYCSIDTAEIAVNIKPYPANAETITGPTDILKNQTALAYSTSPISNALAYSWSFPFGMSTSDTGTSIIASTDNHAYSGLITVRGQNDCGLGKESSLFVKIPKLMNTKLFLEGFYNQQTGLMNKVQDETHDHFTSTTVDKLSLEIVEPNLPYITIGKQTLNLSTDGTISDINIPGKDTGFYYIVVKHRNHLETWSKNPVSFDTDIINYDFTTAASKAYENNQKQLAPGVYGIYAGDVNQDGLIDGSDMSDTETDNNTFVTGYVVTDVNGDGLVDGTDMSIVETNNNNFVGVEMP